jgi:hypothetical protein
VVHLSTPSRIASHWTSSPKRRFSRISRVVSSGRVERRFERSAIIINSKGMGRAKKERMKRKGKRFMVISG